MIKVRALKNVPSFGLILGRTYLMSPYDAATCHAAGFIDYVQDTETKRGRPRKGA